MCFSDCTGLQPTAPHVLGILSLVTWALVVVVTINYMLLVMQTDNQCRQEVWKVPVPVSAPKKLASRLTQRSPGLAAHGCREEGRKA